MDESSLHRSVWVPRVARVGPRVSRELADDAAVLGVKGTLVVRSAGLPGEVVAWVMKVLTEGGIVVRGAVEVEHGTVEEAGALAQRAGEAGSVIGLGGGRALDVGKYAASLAPGAGGNGKGVPFVSVPTSLSHDGFASPSASLVDGHGKRVSLPCTGPAGVVVDTEICGRAPRGLSLAGVGDSVSKITALADWELWEHSGEGKVDGVAAAVARGAVAEVEGMVGHGGALGAGDMERLARALLLGGVAIGMAGGSRPCSGSEHLISHALDRIRKPVGSHGVQVGVAAYVCSQLQGGESTGRIKAVLDRLGFWEAAVAEGIRRDEMVEAIRGAREIKPGYVTVLSRPGAVEEAVKVVETDGVLAGVWKR